MAKGGGGEGHYDERRRATKPKVVSGYADSPEVLAAIQKPSGVTRKPVVVVKKKKLVPVPREKPDVWNEFDNNAYAAAHGRRVNNTSRSPAPKGTKTVPGLRMGAAQAEVRVGNLPRKFGLGPFDDQIVTSASKEDRDTGSVSPASVITAPRKYPSPTSAAKGNRGGGYTPKRDIDAQFGNMNIGDSGRSLLDWVKRRNSRRMLDM